MAGVKASVRATRQSGRRYVPTNLSKAREDVGMTPTHVGVGPALRRGVTEMTLTGVQNLSSVRISSRADSWTP